MYCSNRLTLAYPGLCWYHRAAWVLDLPPSCTGWSDWEICSCGPPSQTLYKVTEGGEGERERATDVESVASVQRDNRTGIQLPWMWGNRPNFHPHISRTAPEYFCKGGAMQSLIIALLYRTTIPHRSDFESSITTKHRYYTHARVSLGCTCPSHARRIPFQCAILHCKAGNRQMGLGTRLSIYVPLRHTSAISGQRLILSQTKLSINYKYLGKWLTWSGYMWYPPNMTRDRYFHDC